MEEYLEPTYFIDYEHPMVQEFASKVFDQQQFFNKEDKQLDQLSKEQKDCQKAIRLFYAVRDGFQYNPFLLDFSREGMRASNLVQREYGYCGEKANLLCALLRMQGIPSRLFFVNVRNHIATGRLVEVLKTDLMAFHGMTEVYLNGEWLQITPAFNKSLCEKLGVSPLEFNGKESAIFQEFDNSKGQFMEYETIHGSFSDIPRAVFMAELKKQYPHLQIDASDKLDLRFYKD